VKALAILPLEDVESRHETIKFTLKYMPFKEANHMVVLIDYLPKLDVLRVVASIGIGKNLKDIFKSKTETEKNKIKGEFAKPLRARNFNPNIEKDFAAMEGHRFLIQQNFSAQQLLDTVNEAGFVIVDVAEKLNQADESVKVPKVSEAAKDMFR